MHVHKLSKYITYYTHINPTSHISLTHKLTMYSFMPYIKHIFTIHTLHTTFHD